METDLSRFVNALPALVWTALPDGRIDFVNRRWCDYTGLSVDAAYGEGWQAAIHPDDIPALLNRWRSILAAGESGEMEARLTRFDGQSHSFLVACSPMRDQTGKIIKWYGVSTDIEGRKRAEEALRASEFDARLIVDSIPGLVVRMTAAGEVEAANRQLLEYSGQSLEGIKNWTTSGLVHPEDLLRAIEIAGHSFATGDPYEMEIRVRRFDGVHRWFQARGLSVRDAEGRVLNWYALHTDIDDQKKVEERLRSIIGTIPTLAWSAAPDGSTDFLNERWLDYTGLSAEQAQGSRWTAAIHPDDLKGLAERWQSSLTSGAPLEGEARIRRFDGAHRWFLIRANPMRDESGRILKWYGTNMDIEDRKRGEEVLRARELSWRQIVDNIPGFVHTTSAMGEVEFINRQTLEYFGKTNEELKDWSRLGIVHPDDLPRVIEAWRKSVETGQAYEIEQRNRRADGVYRWFQARGCPVRNAEDEISAWYWLLTDIDDRKKAEEALQSNERDLKLIIDTMPIFAWSARPDGSVDFLNQRWLDYTGLSPEEALDWRWTVAIHPDDLDRLAGYWRAIMVTGEPGEIETRIRRYDGEYRRFLIRANALRDESGTIVKWYGTNTDIDDRKRAEAKVEQAYLRLAEAQHLSKTGSFIMDLLMDDHNWSEEAFRIFDFDPATKVSVQMIRDIVHPDDRSSFDDVITRGMAGSAVDFMLRIVTSRGALKHIRGTARVMEQVTGRPLFIGALQDVTESKVAEEALNRARSELAHVARVTTLNVLTASIAHEVNQPLFGIITNASTCLRMLESDLPNVDGVREAARRALRDGKRASDVISRLRALFSKKEFTLEPVDLNQATREVIALSLSDLQTNRVILRSELADELPPVTGDRIQLQQVILNLLRNASDAMSSVEARPRDLLIRTERDGGDRVCLTVKDVGVGFTPEIANKLFEAFYTTKKDGMGIGLSVSHIIIEAHHGRLWATANDGPGAAFSFAIPCSPAGVAEIDTRGAWRDPAAAGLVNAKTLPKANGRSSQDGPLF